MRITRGDVTLEVSPVRWTQFWDLWADGGWEPELFDLIDELAPCRFLDVGAWVGPVSLYAAARGCDVTAIEPDPAAAAVLRGNAAMSHLPVTVIEAALADGPGEALLHASEGFGHSTSTLKAGPGAQVSVATVGWPDGPWGLVKVDVEGYETELCRLYPDELAAQPLALSLHAPWWPLDGFRPVRAVLDRFDTLSPPEPQGWDLVICR